MYNWKRKHIEINIWNACNSKCTYCMSSYIDINSIWDKNTILKSIISKKKFYNSIWFIWWEPTIFPNLLEFVKLSKLLGYKYIQITTNWMKLSNLEYFEKLVKNWLNTIKLSISSIYDDIEFAITKVPKAYELKKNAIKNYNILKKKYDIILDTQTVVSKYNYKFIFDIAKNFLENNINSIRMQFVGHYESYPEENLKASFINYDKITPYLKNLTDFIRENNLHQIKIADFPICYLVENWIVKNEKENIIWEYYDFFDEVADGRNKTEFSFQQHKLNIFKCYPLKKCKNCPFKNLKPCPGFNVGYMENLKKFGINEKRDI